MKGINTPGQALDPQEALPPFPPQGAGYLTLLSQHSLGNGSMVMLPLLSLRWGMKKTHIQMLALLLLVATLISCETLPLVGSESSTSASGNTVKQKESPETKFIGTWVYSDKKFSETAKKLGEKDLPSDSTFELSFSFKPDGTGTFSRIISAYGRENEEKQEFTWYYDTSYDKRVWAVMQDNTAERYTLLYENELFLTMNDQDFGTMFFAKKQQGAIDQ